MDGTWHWINPKITKERMVEVVIGEPYKFSVILQTIPEWNIDDTFCNGILLFGVNGDIYPSKILTATLTSEIQPLKEKLTSLATDECLFSMEKKESQHDFENIYVSEAILELYEINELVSQLKIN